MNKLLHCTLTGADENTDPNELIRLSQKYPFVEWGILFSRNNEGKGRYPSREWREYFVQRCRGIAVYKSAHICGKEYMRMFCLRDIGFRHSISSFQRIQLNFNQKFITVCSMGDIFYAIQNSPQFIITQHNKSNADVHKLFAKLKNHMVLFDASGGRGNLGSWREPISNIICGYAGGLDPENIDIELRCIDKVSGGFPIWIDMESGVRTNDKFDIKKCEDVLEKVNIYIGGNK